MKLSILAISAMCLLVQSIGPAWATQVQLIIVSDENTRVKYVGLGPTGLPAQPSAGSPSTWDMIGSNSAIACVRYPAWLVPGLHPELGSTAMWIAPTSDCSVTPGGLDKPPDYGVTEPERGVYLYKKEFKIPATAYDLSPLASAALAADNFGWLYLNDTRILDAVDPTAKNFCGYGSEPWDACGGWVALRTTASVSTAGLSCTNVLATEVHNGDNRPGVGHGPTGVVFALRLSFGLPHAVWLPPVTHDAFAVQNGATLPLKFKLYMQNGSLMSTARNVLLVVHAPPSSTSSGQPVASWSLGNGVDNLRFDTTEYYYIANFKTKNYTLIDGATYTAAVYDGCSGDPLGQIHFRVSTSP